MSRISILHLSDVHYGSLSAFQDDDKSHVKAPLRNSAFRNLNHLLEHYFLEHPLDSVIVSGDTTTRGDAQGFQLFIERTAPLLAKVVAEPCSVCVVAGNHDVKWDLDPQLTDYFDQKFKGYFDFIKQLGATSCLIPTGTLSDSPDSELTYGGELPGPIYIDAEKRLIVLCINSSMRCGEVNTDLRASLSEPIKEASSRIESLLNSSTPGSDLRVALSTVKIYLDNLLPGVNQASLFDIPHVTHSQLDEIRSRLSNTRKEMGPEWSSYVKIAVFHHHVIPFNYQQPEYKSFELLADSAAVLDTLGSFGFQIILTGHKHQPYVQPVNFRGTDLLVVGGMTIGGYPVHGFGQGVRHLQIERSDDQTSVKIADLPCDWQGDLYTRVRELIDSATPYTLEHVHPIKRVGFPKQIEAAVEAQLYGRHFYKTEVVFNVEISEIENKRLQFITTLTYGVKNRSSGLKTWETEYEYDLTTGKVLEARFNEVPIDPGEREFRTGRGIKFPAALNENELGRAHLKVQELFPSQGSVRYTSYYPATDLKVILRTDATNFEFDHQVHYFWDDWPVTKKDYGTTKASTEVYFDHGLLPYQGLQLNWRLKENVV
jgi:3',5'-cyclic AMP phosphodiesterase CpdA